MRTNLNIEAMQFFRDEFRSECIAFLNRAAHHYAAIDTLLTSVELEFLLVDDLVGASKMNGAVLGNVKKLGGVFNFVT